VLLLVCFVTLLLDLRTGKKDKLEDRIDESLREVVELLNDLTWNLRPLGYNQEESDDVDTEDGTLAVLSFLFSRRRRR
jgi:hypothetical protein